jgi:hypothetical protein
LGAGTKTPPDAEIEAIIEKPFVQLHVRQFWRIVQSMLMGERFARNVRRFYKNLARIAQTMRGLFF